MHDNRCCVPHPSVASFNNSSCSAKLSVVGAEWHRLASKRILRFLPRNNLGSGRSNMIILSTTPIKRLSFPRKTGSTRRGSAGYSLSECAEWSRPSGTDTMLVGIVGRDVKSQQEICRLMSSVILPGTVGEAAHGGCTW